MIEFERYNAETGASLGIVTAENLSTKAGFKLFGGCELATATFHATFGDPAVIEPGDAVVIRRNNVEIFSGRCRTAEPQYGKSEQVINIEGWWYRLAERMAVEPARLDHITFGTAEGSDHPTITTAFGVFEWIAANRVANDPASLVTVPAVGSELIVQPSVPAKLAGPFVLYAKDDLSKVLSMLATMEDCVTGITAKGELYYLPRTNASAQTMMTVKAVGDPPADWKQSMHGVPTGSGRFVYDRRGPNTLSIFSRTTTARNAIRDYKLVTDLPPGTSRSAGYRAANIHTGVQARRLARGLFRRFSNFNMKVEELEVRAGTMRFEPHLGRVRIVDEADQPFADDLCGTIEIEFNKTTIAANVTIGENAEDPGSDMPMNDPWATDPGWFDDPQIDTGDGLEIPDYEIPSSDIDLDDDYDGDGDDFHENPDREDPMEDPPGEGVEGVDYGPDEEMPQDPTLEPGEKEKAPAKIYLAGIITVNPGEGGNETYNVQLYKPDGTEPDEQRSNLKTWPDAYFQLQIGQKVLVVEPEGQQAYIDGTPASPLWPGRIALTSPEGPTVQVLLPNEWNVPETTTILGTFPTVPTFPPPSELPEYTVGQIVTLAWFNNLLDPVILQTGGAATGGSTCAVGINNFGVKFG